MSMMNSRDRTIFGRWYGQQKLGDSLEFWQDIWDTYFDQLIPLPLAATNVNQEFVSRLIKCPPGECGACCKYSFIHTTSADITRLSCAPGMNIKKVYDMLVEKDGELGLPGPCKFLADNRCTIYEHRTHICRTFPVQLGITGKTEKGEEVEQIYVRLKCNAAFAAIQAIIRGSLAHDKTLELLPDLNVIRRETNG